MILCWIYTSFLRSISPREGFPTSATCIPNIMRDCQMLCESCCPSPHVCQRVRASADFSLIPPPLSICGVSFTLPFFDYQGNRTSPILLDRSEALPAARRKPKTQASICAAASIPGPCLKILWLMWDYPQSQSWCLSLFPSYTSSSGLVFFFHKVFPVFNFQDFIAQIRCLRGIFYLLHFVMLPQFPQM